MPRRRTTIELDEDLVRAARAVTGGNLRATVEAGLNALISGAEGAAEERRRRVADHLARAGDAVDLDVLVSDEAWR